MSDEHLISPSTRRAVTAACRSATPWVLVADAVMSATDADWSIGEGPEVTGDALHLLAAMTGRKAALDSLSGDGVEIMRGALVAEHEV